MLKVNLAVNLNDNTYAQFYELLSLTDYLLSHKNSDGNCIYTLLIFDNFKSIIGDYKL